MEGCVYLFRIKGTDYVKIEFTENNSPVDDFLLCDSQHPIKLESLGFLKDDNAEVVKNRMHETFKVLKLRNSWFKIPNDFVVREMTTYNFTITSNLL